MELKDGRINGVAYDLIKNPPKLPLSSCLLNIRKTMEQVLEEFKPDVVAVEGIFYSKYLFKNFQKHSKTYLNLVIVESITIVFGIVFFCSALNLITSSSV